MALKEFTNRKSLYLLKDKTLNEIVGAFLLRSHEVPQHFGELANDIKSPFYNRQDDFVIYNFGDCIDDNFSFSQPEENFIHLLSEFKDDERIKLQYLAQTLNFLPPGYYKMNDEQLKDVRDKLNKAINDLAKIRFGEINVQSLVDEVQILQAKCNTLSSENKDLISQVNELKN